MEIRVLRYFLVICQEKNISKAAQRLHLSQPTLSKQIKELEQQLGVSLFIRGHRKITLTEEGYFLRDRAQEIVDLIDDTTQILEKAKVISGVLRIGAGQSPALYPVMKVINNLLVDHPDVKVNFLDENADVVERQVNQGSLDFGIVMGHRILDDFNSLTLKAKNEFVAIFNKDLPLANKKVIKPKDLIDYSLLISNQTHVKGKFQSWFGDLYPKIHVVGGGNLAFNSSLLAEAGNIVQFSYKNLVSLDNTNLVQRPLEPKVKDANTLIWKKDVQRSNLANLFLEKIKENNL